METPQPAARAASPVDRINNWARTSTMLKLLIIGFLILLLLIPTGMLQSLIREREITRDQAIQEVSAKWGFEQTIGGPVLSVPVRSIETDEKGRRTPVTYYVHFLPDDLRISGSLRPEQRSRGIYNVMLYNSNLTISGRFGRPSVEQLAIAPADVQWDKAFLALGISDMKGIKETIRFRLNGREMAVNPGIATDDILASGVSIPLALNADTYQFSCTLNVNGSTQLNFLPFGKETTVSLTSPWATPSFTGSFLPDQRSVTAEGFRAQWRVLQYNRNYPQQGIGAFISKRPTPYTDPVPVAQPRYDGVAPATTSAADLADFGVKLLLPVDEYQKTTRSAKYAVMFIIITFTVFFFVEILARRRIHPIQYLLVGFAISLFYLLLLSISEHINFDRAYWIGAAVIVALVTFYVRYVFQNGRLTVLFSGLLTLLYGFFYSLLQLEDYSLLLGSLGLLLILAVVMYLTRHVNWYRAYETE